MHKGAVLPRFMHCPNCGKVKFFPWTARRHYYLKHRRRSHEAGT
jgi:hypothetical protein